MAKKAKLVLHNKVLLSCGAIVEMKIWDVKGDIRYPNHYKYSLFCYLRR